MNTKTPTDSKTKKALKNLRDIIKKYLPKKYAELAISRIDKDYCISYLLCDGVSEDNKILFAFDWLKTPEGHVFWHSVYLYVNEKIGKKILISKKKMSNKLPKFVNPCDYPSIKKDSIQRRKAGTRRVKEWLQDH